MRLPVPNNTKEAMRDNLIRGLLKITLGFSPTHEEEYIISKLKEEQKRCAIAGLSKIFEIKDNYVIVCRLCGKEYLNENGFLVHALWAHRKEMLKIVASCVRNPRTCSEDEYEEALYKLRKLERLRSVVWCASVLLLTGKFNSRCARRLPKEVADTIYSIITSKYDVERRSRRSLAMGRIKCPLCFMDASNLVSVLRHLAICHRHSILSVLNNDTINNYIKTGKP